MVRDGAGRRRGGAQVVPGRDRRRPLRSAAPRPRRAPITRRPGAGVPTRPRRRRLDAVGAAGPTGCVGRQPVTGDGGAGGRVCRRQGRYRVSAVAAGPTPLGYVRGAHAHHRRGRVGDARAAAHRGSTQRRWSTASRPSAPTPTRLGSRPTDSYTWTCTPTTFSPATTAGSPGSSTGRACAAAIPASIWSGSRTTSTDTISRSGTSSRPPASSRAWFGRTSPTTRFVARRGRSATTPRTCRASAPPVSSIGTDA